MFAEDFKDTGINAVSQLKDVSEEDVKGVGVFEQTHITRLFEEFEKVRKEL